jgi:NADP-dependent 3-hydroxy acid dehydrogenase YdfG
MQISSGIQGKVIAITGASSGIGEATALLLAEESVNNPEVKAQIAASMDNFAIPADAIARAIVFAIEQPANVDVGEIIARPTAQG